MDLSLPFPSMNWKDDSNMVENWRKFTQHAELMFTGPYKKLSEEEKCAYLLYYFVPWGTL